MNALTIYTIVVLSINTLLWFSATVSTSINTSSARMFCFLMAVASLVALIAVAGSKP